MTVKEFETLEVGDYVFIKDLCEFMRLESFYSPIPNHHYFEDDNYVERRILDCLLGKEVEVIDLCVCSSTEIRVLCEGRKYYVVRQQLRSDTK